MQGDKEQETAKDSKKRLVVKIRMLFFFFFFFFFTTLIICFYSVTLLCGNPINVTVFTGRMKKPQILSYPERTEMTLIRLADAGGSHYENMPIQIYRRFQLQKRKNFQIKLPIFYHASAQNIDCGYSLEPPRRLFSKIRKIMYTPVNPSFTI